MPDRNYSSTKTRRMLALEQELGEPLETFLRTEYYDHDRTLQGVVLEISRRTGHEYNTATIWHWLRRLGIPAKTLQPPAEAV